MKLRRGDREYDADPSGARRLDDGSWEAGGRRVWVARTAAGIEAWCAGRVWRFEKPASSRRRAGHGGEDIVSPMTGKVAKVLVIAGDEVRHGDVLVIVEAMKMEHRVVSPRAGKVTAVRAREGALVEMGEVLVDVAG